MLRKLPFFQFRFRARLFGSQHQPIELREMMI
jgi:hypothetical protein